MTEKNIIAEKGIFEAIDRMFADAIKSANKAEDSIKESDKLPAMFPDKEASQAIGFDSSGEYISIPLSRFMELVRAEVERDAVIRACTGIESYRVKDAVFPILGIPLSAEGVKNA